MNIILKDVLRAYENSIENIYEQIFIYQITQYFTLGGDKINNCVDVLSSYESYIKKHKGQKQFS